MANVATLTVRLSANSAALVKEFAKTQRRAKTFANKMKGALASVGRAFGRIGLAAGPALIAIGAAGVKSADQLAKTAAKLGIAANELAGLRLAAEQTGVPLKTFDLALQRLTRRSAEAARGMGEAKGAIAELGLDAAEFGRLSPDEQIYQLADAFAAVENQGQKLRLGFKLFDSEGVALVNTLALGSDELRRYRDEARRLGLVLSDTQIKNIEEAANAQNLVAKAFTGFSRQLGATLAPAMELAATTTASLIARLTESIPKLGAVASGILGIERAVESLTTVELEAEIQNLYRLAGDAVDARDQAKAQLERGVGNFASGIAQESRIKNAQARIDKYQARVIELRLQLDKLAETQVEVTRSTINWTGVTDAQKAALASVIKLFNEGSLELDQFIKKQDQLAAAGASIFAATRTPVERFVASMKEAREAMTLEDSPVTEEVFERYRKQLLEGLVPAIDEVKEKTNELAFTFSSAFEDALVEGGKLREILAGIYKDLLRILARKTITEPLGNALSGFFSGLIPGRASGGPVSAGTPYWVGENRQPELFVPSQAGQIIPANKVGGGGNVFNFTTNISNKGNMDAETLVPILEENNRRVKGEFLDELNRGKYD